MRGTAFWEKDSVFNVLQIHWGREGRNASLELRKEEWGGDEIPVARHLLGSRPPSSKEKA